MTYHKSSYSGDPRWTTAKYDCKCDQRNCGVDLHKGDKIFWYPAGSVYCEECGDEHSRDFEASRFDEDNTNACF